MGLALSCPGAGYDTVDESLDALLQSLSIGNDYIKSSLRSVSFNGRDSEPVLKVWCSGKLVVKGSLSFNKREKSPFHGDPKFSTKNTTTLKEHSEKSASSTCASFAPLPIKISESIGSPKYDAAVKLQKVYKSFRTRRQLADCAVLVEQRWWKLLDFAMLKRSSVSFFHVEKTESVVSKWARAKSRAAKVGKGLSKDEKAQKLALQHWLEAIDPRHRYGHNLHFYYDYWLRCESKQPFFYWLDVGEGKEVSLDEKCPRSKLQHQCIKYLGPKEREVYEVLIEDGKLLFKKSGTLLDTTEDSTNSKWIFVLSTLKILYVGQKKKGTFQHSSFLAGGATSAAGRLEVQNGILKAISPHSGHYRPTEENFQEFIAYLQSKNVDLTDVKKSPIEEDEEPSNELRTIRSELNLARIPSEESEEQKSNVLQTKSHKRSQSCDVSLDFEETESTGMKKILIDESEDREDENGKPNTGSEPPTKFRKENLFAEEREGEEPKVSSELIIRRMKSQKEALSLQLGKQLSCKWTTGAGPRIGCVRDYPSELRIQALEQVNLSPKTGEGYRSWPSPGNSQSPIRRASRCS